MKFKLKYFFQVVGVLKNCMWNGFSLDVLYMDVGKI